MLHIIITSYKEPKSTEKAINSFLSQNIKEKFKIIIIDPFPETENFLKEKFSKEFKKKQIEFFLDSGEGKSYALNILLEKIYSTNIEDIIILTDGDVFVSQNTVQTLLNEFKNKQVGCVTGKPTPINTRKNMFGYWSHLLFDGIDKTRKKLHKKQNFFECSGYLFAIRNSVLQGFPLETAEDSIIPYLFYQKKFRIAYAPQAEVYVLSPQNWKDWKLQKIRNIKAHENLNNLDIAKNMQRTKSFINEIKEGMFFALQYPKNIREFAYTIALYFARLYIYLRAFYELKFKKQTYQDGWRVKEIQTTKILD